MATQNIVYRLPTKADPCKKCGYDNLQWVATKWSKLLPGGKVAPADGSAPAGMTADGWFTIPFGSTDFSGTQHALTPGRCAGVNNAAPAAQPAPATITVPADQGIEARMAAIEADIAKLGTRPAGSGSAVDDARIDAIEQQFQQVTPLLDEIRKRLQDKLAEMSREIKANATARPITVTIPNLPTVNLGRQHYMTPNVLATVLATKGKGVAFMVGAAGTGKSFTGAVIAKALNARRFVPLTCGQSLDETDFLGYTDANGKFVDKWGIADLFENGGVLFLDEIGNNSPAGAVAVNGIICNDDVAFAGGRLIHRHPDFIVIAADNTYGRGADALYIARSQLDAATLNRMCYIPFDTDWSFAGELSGLTIKGDKPDYGPPTPDNNGQPWTQADFADWGEYVRSIARTVETQHIEAAIGQRQVFNGILMLMAGIDRKLVEFATIWAHMDFDSAETIRAHLGIANTN